MKDIINIIIGKEDITVLDKYTSNNKEVFERYKNIVKMLIKYGKIVYSKGLSLEKLIELVQQFFSEYSSNVVISGYYNLGHDEEKIDEEVKNMLTRILGNLNVNITLDEVDINSSFSNTSGVEQNKSLRLSNGHPTWTETGFASPLLLAILTATIEITSLLYVFFSAME